MLGGLRNDKSYGSVDVFPQYKFKTEASMGSLPPSLTDHVYFHTANRNLNNKLPLFEKANVKKNIPR